MKKNAKLGRPSGSQFQEKSLYYTFVKKSQEKMSTSLNIRETQIESTTRYRLTPVRRPTVKNSTNIKSCRGCDEKGTLFCRCWKYKLGTATIEDVRTKVEGVEGVKGANVNLVFEPAWDQSMMSEEARVELGFD